MARRPPADHLFGAITSFDNLVAAARRCFKGKRGRLESAAYCAGLERNLLQLQDELRSGAWQPGGYRSLVIHEPKRRMISVAPFSDRVVHQALCAQVGPVLERGWCPHSHASRKGHGQHRAIAQFEQLAARHAWVLRADIYRYFPSIDHAILKALLRRRIACAPTLAPIDRIVDGSNAQEPVHGYFDGDELWTPFDRRRGLPLGNLTSQVLGNHYLDALDHWLVEVQRIAGVVRYLDDLAVFGDSPQQLADVRAAIAQHLQGRRLRLHPEKTQILPSAQRQVFLGLELCPGGYRRLPAGHLGRALGRIAQWRRDWAAGHADEAAVRASVQSWVAHARHADTYHLR